MTSYQMMFGINVFSMAFSLWALVQVRFVIQSPRAFILTTLLLTARRAMELHPVHAAKSAVSVARCVVVGVLGHGSGVHLPHALKLRRPGLYHHHDVCCPLHICFFIVLCGCLEQDRSSAFCCRLSSSTTFSHLRFV